MCQRNKLQLLSNCYTSTTIIDEGNSLITTPPSNNGSFCIQYSWNMVFRYEKKIVIKQLYQKRGLRGIWIVKDHPEFEWKLGGAQTLPNTILSCTERTIFRQGPCYEWVSLINICCTRVAVWEQLKTIPLAHLFKQMLRSFVCKGDEKSQTQQM